MTYVGSPGDPTGRGWQGEQTALTLAVPRCLTLSREWPRMGCYEERLVRIPGQESEAG